MHNIKVLGLSGEFEDLSNRTISYLSSGAVLILKTEKLRCFDRLVKLVPGLETLDALYNQAEDFDELNERIVSTLIDRAQAGEVIYGVEDSRDESVGLLKKRAGERVELVGGSFSDGALLSRMRGPGMVLAAIDVMMFEPDAAVSTLVREIDRQLLASEVKMQLMRRYPDEHPILMQLADGRIVTIPLTELDRQDEYSHRVAALVPSVNDLTVKRRYGFSDLVKIIAKLRGEGGCPWDRAQTHESLRTCILEEAYEVCDATDQGEVSDLYEELGDLLMVIVMEAQVGADHGEFDMDDVATTICEKMLRRHPHIFGTATASTEAEVIKLWEDVKSTEKGGVEPEDKLTKIAAGLPSTIRADEILKKVSGLGLDLSDVDGALNRLLLAADGLRRAISENTNVEERIGEVLFSVVHVARLSNISAETALNLSNRRFIDRFIGMCRTMKENGGEIGSMTLPKMDAFLECSESVFEKM